MRRLCRGQKGFTLIEVLVVVAILGILAAVVVPRIGGLLGEGKQEAAETELRTIQIAVTAAMAENDWETINAKTGVSNFDNAVNDDTNNAVCDIETGAGVAYLYPQYLSMQTAGALTPTGVQITYSWTSDGIVTASYTGPW